MASARLWQAWFGLVPLLTNQHAVTAGSGAAHPMRPTHLIWYTALNKFILPNYLKVESFPSSQQITSMGYERYPGHTVFMRLEEESIPT